MKGLELLRSPRLCTKYYQDGIDELIYIDTVASLAIELVFLILLKKLVKDVFIPLTVGGGIRTFRGCRSSP